MTKNVKLIIIAAEVVIVFAIVAFMIMSRLSSGSKLSENLDLGNRYLTEQDYEEAVAAFLVAIDIDPKCAEAYIGAADAYIGLGDYNSALAILEQGLDATDGDESISEKIEEVQEEIAKQESGEAETETEESSESDGDDTAVVLQDGVLYVNYDWDFRDFNLFGATVMEDGADAVAAQFGLAMGEDTELTSDGYYLYSGESEYVDENAGITYVTRSITFDHISGGSSSSSEGATHSSSGASSRNCASYDFQTTQNGNRYAMLYCTDETADYIVEGLYWSGMTYDDVCELFRVDEIAEYYPEILEEQDVAFHSNLMASAESANTSIYISDWLGSGTLTFWNDGSDGAWWDYGYIEYYWDEDGNVFEATLYVSVSE